MTATGPSVRAERECPRCRTRVQADTASNTIILVTGLFAELLLIPSWKNSWQCDCSFLDVESIRKKIMVKRIGALVFIFVCTSIAWAILGSTILERTYSPLSGELKSRVAASWGTAQKQTPPKASYQHEVIQDIEDKNGPKKIKKIEPVLLA